MNAEVKNKINATRMRSPLHALCLRREEVVNRCLLGDYAVTAPGDIDFTFPPLGCAHSIPGKNDDVVFVLLVNSPRLRCRYCEAAASIPSAATASRHNATRRRRR